VLRSTLLLVAVIGTLAFNFGVLLPVMARTEFSGGAGTFGLMSAVMGAGTLLGALTAASRPTPTRTMLYGSALAYGLLIIIIGLAPTLSLTLAVLVPMGAAGIAFLATANATLQLHADDHMRGRVMSLHGMVFLGSTPIGSPLAGWISEQLGVRAAFFLGGIGAMIAAVGSVWWLCRMRAERGAESDLDWERTAA
jgi:predicted MFS family arabinose efflux permease